MNLCVIRPGVCRPPSGYLWEMVAQVVPCYIVQCKVYYLHLLLIWTMVSAPKAPWLIVGTTAFPSFPFPPFLSGFKVCKLPTLTYENKKKTWNVSYKSVSYKSVKSALRKSTIRVLFQFPICINKTRTRIKVNEVLVEALKRALCCGQNKTNDSNDV